MSFYSQVVFPRLCDFVMRQPFLVGERRRLLHSAFGRVLEIGFGTGVNLPYYPKHVRQLAIVDPNPGMFRLAQRRIRQAGIKIEQYLQSGERLPFADDAFDCVVSTFTLCSIDTVERALGEVYRVLKPAGRFLFLEHGLSPDPTIQKWQRRLNWLEMKLAEGCRLDRDIRALVAGEPFAEVSVEAFALGVFPPTHTYLYRGVARK